MNNFVIKAIDCFQKGYNCAQSVSCVFSEKYKMPVGDCFRANSGFGGGLKAGETCGAAVGGVFVLGLAFGPSSPDQEEKSEIVNAKTEEKSEIVNAKTKEFMARFKEIKGCTSCSDILGATPAQRAEQTQEEKTRDRAYCNELIEKAVEILEDLGC